MIQQPKVRTPKLRFPGFSGEWEVKKLGELFVIKSASRVHKDEWATSGVPFFRSSDVTAQYKGEKNEKAYISQDLYEKLCAKSGRPEKGDILVTGGGSVGIPYLIQSNLPLYFKDADLLWIKHSNDFVPFFLFLFLATPKFRRYLNDISHTGTIGHYTIEQAKATSFAFPGINEQEKIAGFLTVVDERVVTMEKKVGLLKKYKKGVMQKIFTQQIRFKDKDGHDYPAWQTKKLGDIFDGQKGSGLSWDDVIQNGKNKCILYGELYTKYPEIISNVMSRTNKEAGIVSKKNDLLLPCSTTTTGIDLANATALDEEDVLLGGDIAILRFRDKGSSVFYAYYLSHFLKNKLAAFGQGSTIVHMYYSHYKNMLIVEPSMNEQQKIADFLGTLDDKIKAEEAKLEQVRAYKKSLLQRMFV